MVPFYPNNAVNDECVQFGITISDNIVWLICRCGADNDQVTSVKPWLHADPIHYNIGGLSSHYRGREGNPDCRQTGKQQNVDNNGQRRRVSHEVEINWMWNL